MLPETGKWISAEADKGGMINDIAFTTALLPAEAAGAGVEPALEGAAEAGHVGVAQIFGHGGHGVVRQPEQLGGAAAEGLVTELLEAGVFLFEFADQGARAHVQLIGHGIQAGFAMVLMQ